MDKEKDIGQESRLRNIWGACFSFLRVPISQPQSVSNKVSWSQVQNYQFIWFYFVNQIKESHQVNMERKKETPEGKEDIRITKQVWFSNNITNIDVRF